VAFLWGGSKNLLSSNDRAILSQTHAKSDLTAFIHHSNSNRIGPLFANRQLRGGNGAAMLSCSFSKSRPDILCSVSKDGLLILWALFIYIYIQFGIVMFILFVLTHSQNICSAAKIAEVSPSLGDILLTCTMNTDLIVCGGMANRVYVVKQQANQKLQVLSSLTNIESMHAEGFISSSTFLSEAKLLTGSGDHTAKISDVTTDTIVSTFMHENEVMAVKSLSSSASSAATHTFATASGTNMSLWDSRASAGTISTWLL
jgi:WD40 repeat protein